MVVSLAQAFLAPFARLPTVSTKDPDKWVCVGRKTKKPRVTKIYNEEVLLYRSEHKGTTLAVRNVCPHRGARLSYKCKIEDDCVKCAYHGMRWGADNNAHNYLQVKEDGEVVWVNAGVGDGESEPPTMPEFADETYRTFSYETRLAAHPQIIMENLLDYAHLEHVHKVKIVDADIEEADVRLATVEAVDRGKSVYTYPVSNEIMGRLLLHLMPAEGKGPAPPPGSMKISIENEFVLPYTSSLRFTVSGHEKPAFVLWFSVLPYERDNSLVTCRVARNILVDPAWDFLFWLLNVLPLKEDDDMVRNVAEDEWHRNRLTPSDKFVKTHRECMKKRFGAVFMEPFA